MDPAGSSAEQLPAAHLSVSAGELREERIRREREFYLDPANLLDFIRDFGAAPDAEEWPHGAGLQWSLDWEVVLDENGRELKKPKIILWPRGSFKTQVFSVGKTAWRIAKNPNVRHFIGSETGRQARKIARTAMRIVDSPRFIEVFGKHRGTHWSYATGTFTSALRSGDALDLKEPTLASFGVGEVQTGAHWDSGTVDDAISSENTKTPEAIQTTEDWFGELMAQLDPGSELEIPGTHHHHADYYATAKKDPDRRKLFQISSHAYKDENGKLFFPQRLTETYVQWQKARMSPRMWSCFYLNTPISGEEQLFLPEYFRVIRDEDVPARAWTYILTDFAFSSLKKNDSTCFWVVSLDTNRVAYVWETVIGRWKPSESVRRLCELWDKYLDRNLKGVTIEDTAHDELLKGLIEEVRRNTFQRPRVVAISGRSDEIKNMRIEGIEPRFRRGDIYFVQSFRNNARAWNAMFRAMTEWPFSATDDCPDSISDLDKRDKDDKRFLLPGPPAGWTVLPARSQTPVTINGSLNPDVRYDPREALQRRAAASASGDLWQRTVNPGQPVHSDLFRSREKPPSR